MYAKGAWNFGPDKKNFLKVKYFLKKINAVSKLDIKWNVKKSNFHESKILKLNNNKSKKLLKWKPILSINEMIDLTCSWYKQYLNNKLTLYDLTLNQVKFFFKKIK